MTAPAIERFDEPAAFLSAAEASLLRDEARNNLFLGLAQRLGQPPPLGVAEAYVVRGRDGAPVAVAVRSERRGLVVSDGPADALAALADEIVDAGVALPAANGPEPAVGAFVARYRERTGAGQADGMRTRLHRLDTVVAPRAVPGAMRAADEPDRALAARWIQAFSADTGVPGPTPGTAEALDQRRLFLWDDGGPVAMAAWGRPTPNGCSIGLVYTPPERRGRGYASALVAALSQRMLDGGKRFCTLYTDLANPTSNAIYARIGYRPLADFRLVRFEPRGDETG